MEIRKIRYEIINKEHRDKAGIYVMYVGEMLYIGQALNFKDRIRTHCSFENNAFRQNAILKKHNKRGNKKLIKHLTDNPNIETIFIEIVEICDDPEQLDDLEKKWLEAAIQTGFKDLLLNKHFYNISPITLKDLYAIGLMD